MFIFVFALSSFAQQNNSSALTAKDYERAEKFMSYYTAPLIDHASVNPNWLPEDRFWYRVLTAQGSEFILVHPVKGTRVPAFNQQKLAIALSKATGVKYNASRLPFQTFRFSPDEKSIYFTAAQKNWQCNLKTYACTLTSPANTPDPGRPNRLNEVLSPDGKKAAFVRNYNLWMRDLETSKETQLTTDGVQDFGYATDNAGWRKSDRPILL